ncbi:MAG: hypothetical protein ACI8SR_001328 [Oceanicoccus sp.]|jgi:hypothetical protein
MLLNIDHKSYTTSQLTLKHRKALPFSICPAQFNTKVTQYQPKTKPVSITKCGIYQPLQPNRPDHPIRDERLVRRREAGPGMQYRERKTVLALISKFANTSIILTLKITHTECPENEVSALGMRSISRTSIPPQV